MQGKLRRSIMNHKYILKPMYVRKTITKCTKSRRWHSCTVLCKLLSISLSLHTPTHLNVCICIYKYKHL